MRGACLRDLNLDGCSALGDAAVRMVCRACPRLSDLSLLECSAVSFAESSTLKIRTSCEQTGFLDLFRFTLTSAQGIRCICKGEAPQ